MADSRRSGNIDFSFIRQMLHIYFKNNVTFTNISYIILNDVSVVLLSFELTVELVKAVSIFLSHFSLVRIYTCNFSTKAA